MCVCVCLIHLIDCASILLFSDIAAICIRKLNRTRFATGAWAKGMKKKSHRIHRILLHQTKSMAEKKMIARTSRTRKRIMTAVIIIIIIEYYLWKAKEALIWSCNSPTINPSRNKDHQRDCRRLRRRRRGPEKGS